VTSIAERRAAYNMAQPAAPLVLRTWHGVEFTDGGIYGGLRGFLIGTCPHNRGLLRLKRIGADVIVCCVRPSTLAGFPTRHGGVRCPGVVCTEGDVINLEEEL
jgi:hypothetical protein